MTAPALPFNNKALISGLEVMSSGNADDSPFPNTLTVRRKPANPPFEMLMRRTFFIVTTFALLLSCNNKASTNSMSDMTADAQPMDTVQSISNRRILIEELQSLGATFASKDKERIANLFQFPLSDTTIGIYINDSSYLEQFRYNGDETTRAMFTSFFPQIYHNLQIDELNQLFQHIPLEGLLHKDTLEREVHLPTKPCYQFYSITVETDLVTLSTGSGVNESYQGAPSSNGEVQENSSEFCEHVLWWVFRFDGKRLHFVKQHGAG